MAKATIETNKNKLSQIQDVIDNTRREVRYVSTDFTGELLAQKFKEKPEDEGDIYVPDYQRSLQWTAEKKSYFIESLILKVPVPPVFFYDVEGRLEIVDGSQRIRSLISYLKGEFKLRDLETLDVLNGFKFDELPLPTQKRLKNTPIRSFVLDQSTDETTRIEVFRRINTSGKKLSDAEIRKGAYRGPFQELVLNCAKDKHFVVLCPAARGSGDPDSERQELVTRFFVYSDKYREFTHDVRRFLDEHTKTLNKTSSPVTLKKKLDEFNETIKFIKTHYPSGFRRIQTSKQVPRVRFEAVAVGTLLAIRTGKQLNTKNTKWLWSVEFGELVRTDASNSGPKLRARIEFVRDRLLAK